MTTRARTPQVSPQATVNLPGYGPVEVKTHLDWIRVAGAMTMYRTPVNTRLYRVVRNKKAAAKAALVEGIWLQEVEPGTFLPRQDWEFQA